MIRWFPEDFTLTEIEPTRAESDQAEPQSETDSDQEWHAGQGEAPDASALTALQLAHRAVAKFPELTKRYQKFIGTAAVVSSAIIVLASIAVTRRLHRGEGAEDILASITPDEIENAGKQRPIKPSRNGGSDEETKKRRFQH
jgi:hypothetical protein